MAGEKQHDFNSIHESFAADEDALFDGGGEDPAGAEPAITKTALEPAGKQGGAAEEDQAGTEEKQTIVPYNALHEERQLRKETQAELRRTQDEVAGMRERMKLLDKLEARLSERQSKEQQAAAEEEFEADPIGHLRSKQAAMEAKLAEQEQHETQVKEHQALIQRMQQDVATRVRDFMKETPDYQEAFQHLMAMRFREYQAMGVESPQELTERFEQYSMQLAIEAMKRGKNPGELVYELAKSQGYKKAEPTAETDTGKEEAAASLEAQLDKLERGGKAARSVSNGGSPVNAKKLSLADIDNMSDADIDALWDEMQGQGGDDLGI